MLFHFGENHPTIADEPTPKADDLPKGFYDCRDGHPTGQRPIEVTRPPVHKHHDAVLLVLGDYAVDAEYQAAAQK
jgi:hypothetical protein